MMMVSKTGGMTPLQRPHMQMESVEGQYRSSGQYDSVELKTAHYSEDQRFSLELSSRLAQEVRTQQSEEVPQVRQQILNGDYQINIDSLAAQIMLLGGVC